MFKSKKIQSLLEENEELKTKFQAIHNQEDNIKNPKSKVVTATGNFSKKGIALKFLGIYKDVLDVNLVSTKM